MKKTLNDLPDEALQDFVTALGMRISYMETGDVTMRAQDAINSGQQKRIRPLTPDQIDVIRRMEESRRAVMEFISHRRIAQFQSDLPRDDAVSQGSRSGVGFRRR